MKKRFLSLLMALCLMLTLAPAAFAVDASTAANSITVTTETDLQNAVSASASYDLVTLGSDITLTGTLSINRGVTISGGSDKHTLTYNGTAADGAVAVNTDDPVVMDNLIVTVTNAQTRGIKLATTSPKFTFSNSELNASFRGIWVYTSCDSNSVITVSNSTIQNNQIPEGRTYDNWANCTDTRGIALWDMNNSRVYVTDSQILGFGYTINLTGTLVDGTRNYNGTEIYVENSRLKGWTAFNVWSSKTKFYITNSYLLGVNTWSQDPNDFATIVVNDDIYNNGWGGTDANEFYFVGGTVTSARSGSSLEQLFRIDNSGVTEVHFGGSSRNKTKFIDGTGDSTSVFFSGAAMDTTNWETFFTTKVFDTDNATLTGYGNATLVWTPAHLTAVAG